VDQGIARTLKALLYSVLRCGGPGSQPKHDRLAACITLSNSFKKWSKHALQFLGSYTVAAIVHFLVHLRHTLSSGTPHGVLPAVMLFGYTLAALCPAASTWLGPNRAAFHPPALDSWRLVMRVVVEKGLQVGGGGE
jgi:hypothetical protein